MFVLPKLSAVIRSYPQLRTGSQEVQFPFDSLQSLLGEHFVFLRLLLLLKAGVPLSLVGKVALAFEAAGSEAGKGVECAQEVERVELDGLAEGVSADFS